MSVIPLLQSDHGGRPEVTFQGWHSLYAPQQLLTACICMACRDPEESPIIVLRILNIIPPCRLWHKLHCGQGFYRILCYRRLSHSSLTGKMCTS